MADTALKAANVEVLAYSSPLKELFSNECILAICGDSGAVRQAIIAAREVGIKLETLVERLHHLQLLIFKEKFYLE